MLIWPNSHSHKVWCLVPPTRRPTSGPTSDIVGKKNSHYTSLELNPSQFVCSPKLVKLCEQYSSSTHTTGAYVLVRTYGVYSHILFTIGTSPQEIPAILNTPVIMSMSHSLPCFVTFTITRSAVNKMCRYFSRLSPRLNFGGMYCLCILLPHNAGRMFIQKNGSHFPQDTVS